MIKMWLRGIITSCEAVDNYVKKVKGHRIMIDVSQFGSQKMAKGDMTFFMDLEEAVPVGAKIEFVYEIGAPDA